MLLLLNGTEYRMKVTVAVVECNEDCSVVTEEGM